jgi:hypothetical protein
VSRLGWAAVLCVLPQLAHAWPVETIIDNGPPAKRINLVLLGDGYRDVDQVMMSADAARAVTELFRLTPYLEYRGLFNVKLVHVVSKEAGADRGTLGILRDTALDSTYGCQGIERALCADPAKVLSAALENVPEYDVVVVLVNDAKSGGATSGGVPVLSNGVFVGDVLRHELGHSMGGLADEYEEVGIATSECGEDCVEPNVSRNLPRARVKWRAWIPAATPVPTPETGAYPGIGLFEGGRYASTGVFRPLNEGCLMRSLFVPFCSVCTEAMVHSFWNRVKPIESALPEAHRLTVCDDGPVDLVFAVTHPPVISAWTYEWKVNSAETGDGSAKLTVASSALKAGENAVWVRVQQRTALVRSDPRKLLNDTAIWSVDRCTPGPCEVTARCDASGACSRVYKAAGTGCGFEGCVNGSSYAPGQCDATGRCSSVAHACANGCDLAGRACLTPDDAGQFPPPEERRGCGCAAASAELWLLAAVFCAGAARKRGGLKRAEQPNPR